KGVGTECKAHVHGPTKKSLSTKNMKKSLKTDGSSKPHIGNRKINPFLPFNKLSLLPGQSQPVNRRKKSSKSRGEKQDNVDVAGDVESDSLHNSDFSSSVQDGGINVMLGIDLEVVLPSFPEQEEGPVPVGGRENSGLELLLQSGSGDGVPDRRVEEAEKLIKLAEDVGLKFQGGEGEDLARMVSMEGRDCEEKEGREMRRENSGFQ
ncbi:hypothetical protein A2U01_0004867, partial [Trifolium medium]|nr:hypothetical protein [Trifolium medium]